MCNPIFLKEKNTVVRPNSLNLGKHLQDSTPPKHFVRITEMAVVAHARLHAAFHRQEALKHPPYKSLALAAVALWVMKLGVEMNAGRVSWR